MCFEVSFDCFKGWRLPDMTARGASYRIKGKIYRACVQSVLAYGTETWVILQPHHGYFKLISLLLFSTKL